MLELQSVEVLGLLVEPFGRENPGGDTLFAMVLLAVAADEIVVFQAVDRAVGKEPFSMTLKVQCAPQALILL